MKREQLPQPEDLRVFLTVLRKQSFVAAAAELGQSPAYVSKRIKILEDTLKAKLLHRSTRQVTLTEDGEKIQHWASQVLGDLSDMAGELSQTRTSPKGLLRVCSTFGFGRIHIAPALSLLSRQYPQMEFHLELFDRPVDIIRDEFDLEIRVGDDLPDQYISTKLLDNRRILCAAPRYLQRKGIPESLDDLRNHDCLVIKERSNPFGIWHMQCDGKPQTIRVDGPMSSNFGEIVAQWALDGHGIMLRSTWEVQKHLKEGELVQVLPNCFQMASIWGVYPMRRSHSAKLKVCLDFLEQHFREIMI
ncbi:LysR substrate-binding domain-containing protein [Kordiimonas pumila]|uniref:LysR substrate-binding domain-containing protein n=1 Tax=Kordiimonas pumila TaxID=2161677 RepID=A0ABV7D4Y5_9PROT|nr:LysR substrate-binding domain-containing protein [Kordiimonas pumila]